MKKFLLIVGGTVIMAAASVWGYSYYQEQTMDPWLKANIAALSNAENTSTGEMYHMGTTGRNWQTYTIMCYVASSATSGGYWQWNSSLGAYVYGVGASAGGSAGGSSSQTDNYAPTSFKKDVCGKGSGWCMSSAPSGHPCA